MAFAGSGRTMKWLAPELAFHTSESEFVRKVMSLLSRYTLAAATAAALAAPALIPGVAGATPKDSGPRTYEITITNNNRTQWFTPPVLAVHERSAQVFSVGKKASIGVTEIAENGNLDPLVGALTGAPGITSVGVAVSAGPPPLAPGESTTLTLTGSNRHDRLSMVAMLICTNDGFSGLDTVRLPRWVGDSALYGAGSYDAGTEVNTENLGDIVPPCQALNRVADPEGEPGSGVSNPALAENGKIKRHRGVQGIDDLTAASHGWDTGQASLVLSITRVG